MQLQDTFARVFARFARAPAAGQPPTLDRPSLIAAAGAMLWTPHKVSLSALLAALGPGGADGVALSLSLRGFLVWASAVLAALPPPRAQMALMSARAAR